MDGYQDETPNSRRRCQRSDCGCLLISGDWQSTGTIPWRPDDPPKAPTGQVDLSVGYHFVPNHSPPHHWSATCSLTATGLEPKCSRDYSSSSLWPFCQSLPGAISPLVEILPPWPSCLPPCKWWSLAICLFPSLFVRFRFSSAPFHSLSDGEHHRLLHCPPPLGALQERRRRCERKHLTRRTAARSARDRLLEAVTLLLLLCHSLPPVGAFTKSALNGESPALQSANHHLNQRDHRNRHHPGNEGAIYRLITTFWILAEWTELAKTYPGQQTEIGLNITRILDSFFDSGYDKRVRPNYAGDPVEVGVTMHIISISSISAVQMDFTSDFYFRQAWRDSRLSFVPRPGIEALFVGAEVIEKIWVPDTFFANEKSAQFHMATTPNTFIRIKNTGEVFRSMRLTVTSSCPMNLQYFPMDRQSCTIEVESYGYSMADIQYKWGIDGKGSVVLAKNLELPQFKVNKHRQMQKVEVLSTGNYSRLVCEIEFVRSMGYYLIQIYIPASLIVIISWVSFWLHRNASPARVQLGVTTVLTMTTLMSSTNAAMPKISYIKSIDVFLGTCFVMVFAALLEYATVGYMGKRIAMRKTRTQQILKILNEHREKCIIAAAAAEGKDALEPGYSAGQRNHSAGGHSALMRTASLYPCLERAEGDESHLHKRDFRSSSTAGNAYQSQYGHHQHGSSHSTQQGNSRPLERSASLKSRVFSDVDDPDPSGVNNYNDDLSVFVPAGSGGGTALGGTSSLYNLAGSSLHQSTSQSPNYHYTSRHSGSDSCYHDGKHGTSGHQAYLANSSYILKDHNTLFGVCPSDIDKYSRVVFPVCFLCFNLMYWIIYMHISEFLIDDQALNNSSVEEGG